MSDWKDCEYIFSNGTEFEIFYDHCLKCTRFRNEKCRILQRIFQAMWDKSKFPYKDLQDHVKYGGKRCRSFTTEKTERHKNKKPVPGQISMFEGERA